MSQNNNKNTNQTRGRDRKKVSVVRKGRGTTAGGPPKGKEEDVVDSVIRQLWDDPAPWAETPRLKLPPLTYVTTKGMTGLHYLLTEEQEAYLVQYGTFHSAYAKAKKQGRVIRDDHPVEHLMRQIGTSHTVGRIMSHCHGKVAGRPISVLSVGGANREAFYRGQTYGSRSQTNPDGRYPVVSLLNSVGPHSTHADVQRSVETVNLLGPGIPLADVEHNIEESEQQGQTFKMPRHIKGLLNPSTAHSPLFRQVDALLAIDVSYYVDFSHMAQAVAQTKCGIGFSIWHSYRVPEGVWQDTRWRTADGRIHVTVGSSNILSEWVHPNVADADAHGYIHTHRYRFVGELITEPVTVSWHTETMFAGQSKTMSTMCTRFDVLAGHINLGVKDTAVKVHKPKRKVYNGNAYSTYTDIPSSNITIQFDKEGDDGEDSAMTTGAYVTVDLKLFGRLESRTYQHKGNHADLENQLRRVVVSDHSVIRGDSTVLYRYFSDRRIAIVSKKSEELERTHVTDAMSAAIAQGSQPSLRQHATAWYKAMTLKTAVTRVVTTLVRLFLLILSLDFLQGAAKSTGRIMMLLNWRFALSVALLVTACVIPGARAELVSHNTDEPVTYVESAVWYIHSWFTETVPTALEKVKNQATLETQALGRMVPAVPTVGSLAGRAIEVKDCAASFLIRTLGEPEPRMYKQIRAGGTTEFDEPVGLDGYVAERAAKPSRKGASYNVTQEDKRTTNHVVGHINGYVFPHLPRIALPCQHNEIIAVVNRGLAAVPPADIPDYSKAIDALLIPAEDVLDDEALFQKWNARFKPAQQKIHESEWKLHGANLDGYLVRRKKKSFIKVEKILKFDELGEPVEYDPRLIQGSYPTHNITLGPRVWELSKAVASQWDGVSLPRGTVVPLADGRSIRVQSVLYSSGQTAQSVSKLFTETMQDQPLFVVESDAKRWDLHVASEWLTQEPYVLTRVLGPQAVPAANVLGDLHATIAGQTRFGVKYKVDATRASGDPETSVGNSVARTLMDLDALSYAGATSVSVWSLGDDGLGFVYSTGENDLEAFNRKYIERWLQLGHEVESVIHEAPFYGVTFCSQRFYHVGGEYVIGPKIGRTLAKSGVTIANRSIFRKADFAVGFLELYRQSVLQTSWAHVPFLRVLQEVVSDLPQLADGRTKQVASEFLEKQNKHKLAQNTEPIQPDQSTWDQVSALYGVSKLDEIRFARQLKNLLPPAYIDYDIWKLLSVDLGF